MKNLFTVTIAVLALALGTSSVEAQKLPIAHGRHCVQFIDPVVSGAKVSRMGSFACFNTFSEAIDAATHGAIQLPRNFLASDAIEESLVQFKTLVAPAAATSSTVIGIDYTNQNYGGTTVVWSTDNSRGCLDGAVYAAANMPSGYDNVISSFRRYQGCDTRRISDGINHTMWSYWSLIDRPELTTIGFDNKISSEKFCPANYGANC